MRASREDQTFLARVIKMNMMGFFTYEGSGAWGSLT